MHDDGRAIVAILTCGVRTQSIERIKQIANRTLPHSRDSVESKCPMPKCRKSRKKPYGRPAVGTKQIGLKRRNLALCAVYDQPCSRLV
jgi:hypothetical protein